MFVVILFKDSHLLQLRPETVAIRTCMNMNMMAKWYPGHSQIQGPNEKVQIYKSPKVEISKVKTSSEQKSQEKV